jgi:hypothetical protein
METECIFCLVEREFLSSVLINFSLWPCQASGALGFAPGQSMWETDKLALVQDFL